MNINEFKILLAQQLYLFVENSLKQPISLISSLINNFIQGRYRKYREQKRVKQLEQYRTLVLSQIEFFQEELEKIDRYKTELQPLEFADFSSVQGKELLSNKLRLSFYRLFVLMSLKLTLQLIYR